MRCTAVPFLCVSLMLIFHYFDLSVWIIITISRFYTLITFSPQKPNKWSRTKHALIQLKNIRAHILTFLAFQPATIKTHNIIERTANFVCQQGAQFEIVLKAKQSGNSQFDFLRFDHYLNPYYKHILRAMKEGRYNLASSSKQEQTQGELWQAVTESEGVMSSHGR